MTQRSQDEPDQIPFEEQDVETKTLELDVEAAAECAEPVKDPNLEHEYSIPNAIKFSWLGTYFSLSLLLTLYNKLVLGMVSRGAQKLDRVEPSFKLTTANSFTFHGY